MRTLSQREFRNQSAEVLRAVDAGESFLLTNHGKPVGKITPVGDRDAELRLTAPATRHGFDDLPMYDHLESTADALTYLRGHR